MQVLLHRWKKPKAQRSSGLRSHSQSVRTKIKAQHSWFVSTFLWGMSWGRLLSSAVKSNVLYTKHLLIRPCCTTMASTDTKLWTAFPHCAKTYSAEILRSERLHSLSLNRALEPWGINSASVAPPQRLPPPPPPLHFPPHPSVCPQQCGECSTQLGSRGKCSLQKHGDWAVLLHGGVPGVGDMPSLCQGIGSCLTHAESLYSLVLNTAPRFLTNASTPERLCNLPW